LAPQRIRPSTRGRRFSSRTRFSEWKSALPSSGYWHIIPPSESETDLLETEELKKERVRLLLDRYGILFRELLLKELPALRWASLFRSLRLMEFSGEVLTGCFFNGIPGLQFISHQAFQRLRQNLAEESTYWINATDPASLCGIQLEEVRGTLPKRVAGTHLVYRGNRIVVVSKRNGRSMSFNVPPDDPQINEYLGFLSHLLARQFKPLRQITIETINEVNAANSEYVDSLSLRFEVIIDYKNVILYRKRV
jgi:ATP-dependent Lhr-like helicase